MEDFTNAFVEADVVLVAPVYAAGEQPIEGIDSEALAEGIRAHGHRSVHTVKDAADLAHCLRDLAADGDLVICMGAGDITKWAAGLAEAVRAERASK
jgi:UDP-N-acetylmuramate--alanine ligase